MFKNYGCKTTQKQRADKSVAIVFQIFCLTLRYSNTAKTSRRGKIIPATTSTFGNK